ncbi:hypothetical protein C0J52_18955 [Blattella germanica]|nr:hypothetical protein C0J52_18955 [Blattella germanica]
MKHNMCWSKRVNQLITNNNTVKICLNKHNARSVQFWFHLSNTQSPSNYSKLTSSLLKKNIKWS